MSTDDVLLTIDVGGTKTSYALLSIDSKRWADLSDHSVQKVPTKAYLGASSLVSRLKRLISDQLEEGRRQAKNVVGVAFSAAGVVDSDSQSIVSATDLIPGWAGTRLADLSDLPVSALNDVHAHGLGEALYGAGVGKETQLVIAVGTGMGGAFIVDGHIVGGAHGVAGHIGHMRHPLAAGLRCSCGRDGHVESVASGSGQAVLYARYTGKRLSGGREVELAAADGDEIARRVLWESGQALGHTIGSLVNSVDPDVVVLSGSVTMSRGFYQEGLAVGAKETLMDIVRGVPIAYARLGDWAPLIGAASHFLTSKGMK